MDEPRERTRAVAFDFVAAPCSPGDPDRKKKSGLAVSGIMHRFRRRSLTSALTRVGFSAKSSRGCAHFLLRTGNSLIGVMIADRPPCSSSCKSTRCADRHVPLLVSIAPFSTSMKRVANLAQQILRKSPIPFLLFLLTIHLFNFQISPAKRGGRETRNEILEVICAVPCAVKGRSIAICQLT